jgi:hypothetical protein
MGIEDTKDGEQELLEFRHTFDGRVILLINISIVKFVEIENKDLSLCKT